MPTLLSALVKEEATDKKCEVRPARQGSSHMGFVKKRGVEAESSVDFESSVGGQVNTAFKTRFFVLSEGMLEYYEDEKTYLVEKAGGLRGSIPTRNIKVTLACDTLSGADK